MNFTQSTQLWLGSYKELEREIIQFLQKQFCASACNNCITCKQLKEKQHHSLLWIEPEKRYTINLLEPIFQTISYALEANQQFFIILHKADLLTPVCANSLLKSIEEPPLGYHFILLAERKELILDTIRSRCIIKEYARVETDEFQELIRLCTVQKDLLTFYETVQKSKLTEDECVLFTEALLDWYVSAHRKKNGDYLNQITFLQKLLDTPPMPGSAKIYLKNLFLGT